MLCNWITLSSYIVLYAILCIWFPDWGFTKQSKLHCFQCCLRFRLSAFFLFNIVFSALIDAGFRINSASSSANCSFTIAVVCLVLCFLIKLPVVDSPEVFGLTEDVTFRSGTTGLVSLMSASWVVKLCWIHFQCWSENFHCVITSKRCC